MRGKEKGKKRKKEKKNMIFSFYEEVGAWRGSCPGGEK
jgi:hypothetical protein